MDEEWRPSESVPQLAARAPALHHGEPTDLPGDLGLPRARAGDPGRRLACGHPIGLIVSLALLGEFSATAKALVVSTLLFWVVFLVVNFVALRILIRQPSVALAGLLALASTIVSLIIVNIAVSGLEIHGASTYVTATVIIWSASALADVLGRRDLGERRVERRTDR